MLKNVQWPKSGRFRSRTEWEPVCFFSEALCNSSSFDLKLGFFSSSAINVLSDGFATFLYNGGRMRMVINDILSEEDKDAIVAGGSDIAMPFFDLNNLELVAKTLSKRDRHFFECLSWLIHNERLEIKIIAPKVGCGIAHAKCGVFNDGLNRVGFEGSCNFSRTALVENLETLSAFRDWDSEMDTARIAEISDDFDKTFCGNDDDVIYLDAQQVKSHVVDVFQNKEMKDLLNDEQELINDHLHKYEIPLSVQGVLARAKQKVERIIESLSSERKVIYKKDAEPRFPYDEPRPYQKQAFENWRKNHQKGLFAMATGTGKTLTSLNCLLQIYNRYHFYKAIILVPTITLVEQWENECRRFHFDNVVKVSSKNKNWKKDIDDIKLQEEIKRGQEPSYVIIATYASFAREQVFFMLNDFKRDVRKQLLLIADEAHNMGSGRIKDRLEGIKFARRIGLSATPNRQYDDEGNESIMKFFGCESDYTFTYSMKDAIDNGVLCRYKYFPHVVHLNDGEMAEYMKISLQLAKFYNNAQESFPSSKEDILMRLLLKRKRIIHKAAEKEEIFKQIINARYQEKGNLKYTLVYVPEGTKPDDENSDKYDATDALADDDFTDNLIDIYTQIVKDVSDTTTVKKFVSGEKDREDILDQFAKGEIEVLTSMKCLDEGVDVPRSELAIFCASTGNPRQFIQRRGRILRTHPDKHMAYIHDLVVAPIVNSAEGSYTMERNLIKGELKRVRDFASLSENADYAYDALEDVLSYYELNLL